MADRRDGQTRQLERTLEGLEDRGGGLILRIVSGEMRGEEHELPQKRPFLIGSSFDATLQLPDTAVSRLHLELISDGGIVHARDLGSTNGSIYEGVRFSAIDLAPGSIVRVGETELQIVAPEISDPLPPSEQTSFGKLLGRSRKMREVFAILERASRTESTILITGETGTGKEVVAESVHGASPRKDGPFVVVDCASIPSNLIESELFGHVKGAYTHAVADRQGAFVAANGGTIFLDEIGELPLELQPRLLRVLETRTVKPVGGNEFQKIDVRMIAATNRNLEAEVKAQRFRQDLYFRLAVVKVALPPLRERRDDIVMLARHIAEKFADERGGARRPELSPEVVAALISYDWPGNVRELRNVIHQGLSLTSTGLSIALELARGEGQGEPARDSSKMVNEVGALGLEVFYDLPYREAKKRALEAFELGYARNAVLTCDGNVSRAAEKIGLHRNMLHRILARGK